MIVINKNRILSLLLTLALLLTSFSLTVYADTDIDDNHNDNYVFTETDNGFILEYEQLEDNEVIYYVEEAKDNLINTKKYIKDNGELEFLEEINTTIEYEDDGSIIATIENIQKNTTETQVIGSVSIKSESNIVTSSSSKEWHPLHSDYYRVTRITGHLGIANLTKAAAIGAVVGVVSGGSIVSGSAASVVTFVMNGGWSNLYYEDTTYYPYGNGPGRPLWKAIVKHYYDRNRTNQAGDTLYYDADILTKI